MEITRAHAMFYDCSDPVRRGSSGEDAAFIAEAEERRISHRAGRRSEASMDPSNSRTNGKKQGAGPVRTGDSAQEKPFDAWLDNQLKALYEPLAEEPVPPEMIDLVRSMKGAGKKP